MERLDDQGVGHGMWFSRCRRGREVGRGFVFDENVFQVAGSPEFIVGVSRSFPCIFFASFYADCRLSTHLMFAS